MSRSEPRPSYAATGRATAWGLAENYHSPPGRASVTATHDHDGLQLTLSPDWPGEYRYRGAAHAVPVGSLCVIPPGEPHASRDRSDRPRAASWRVMTVDARYADAGGVRLDGPVVTDPRLVRLADRAATAAGTEAEEDAMLALLDALRLVAGGPGPRPVADHPAGLRRARAYLDALPPGRVDLDTLATEAGMGRFELARAFTRAFGRPPGRYLLDRRMDAARRLLAAGEPPTRAAADAGFSDHSHLNRHLLRRLGVTAGAYAAGGGGGARTF